MTDLVRYLHILSAALWLGAALYWPGDLRRALDAGGVAPTLALRRARAALGLDLGAGVAVFLTGGGLASMHLGNRLTMWGGLALVLTRVVLLFALARPAVRRASAAADGGDLPRARAAAKGVAAYAGIAHLVWAVALALMVFPV
jgi:hypothetical protein